MTTKQEENITRNRSVSDLDVEFLAARLDSNADKHIQEMSDKDKEFSRRFIKHQMVILDSSLKEIIKHFYGDKKSI